jgi:hypothetical protein
MSKAAAGGLGCLGILSIGAVLVVTWYVIDWGFLKGEITVYSAQCKVPVKNGECADYKFTLRPTTYKPMQDQQVVVYWIEGSMSRRSRSVL